MYPLVRELAAKGAPIRVPVTVTCRVPGLARQPFYRCLEQPVTDDELKEANRANALHDAHHDDPSSATGSWPMRPQTRGRRWPTGPRGGSGPKNGWWSAFGKKARSKGKKPGPPVHDDLVQRDFAADAPNQLWLRDTRSSQGGGYLAWQGRIDNRDENSDDGQAGR